ncbi:MAG: sigma-70 family RNA polymerase sigma factor [Phycisphaerae bacterium]|nr:sigma-70 family RNA polymerase sigma factor [Phycisphaerae bacterium]
MIKDELLKLRFACGSQTALEDMYKQYQNDLLTVAMALLNNTHTAEDVLHDVFVRLAGSRQSFRLSGNLKSFLMTCVVNRARDVMRHRQRSETFKAIQDQGDVCEQGPYDEVRCTEQSQQVNQALAQLPYEQREAVILHIKADLSFKEIARKQQIPWRTVQGRYRYGLDKLRSILNHEIES